ncbi:hypothetical protein NDU88_000561 [Pleurodeles waltl]|uniref:Uncharacterized protein n=1 Tax=Pleurodeles waltl TaxID=8319 RepID=A0AAV7R8H2_PLEWA|nr:hypothetical protein NDU88_000561 [Pleurodeles waltl]
MVASAVLLRVNPPRGIIPPVSGSAPRDPEVGACLSVAVGPDGRDWEIQPMETGRLGTNRICCAFTAAEEWAIQGAEPLHPRGH